MFDSTTQRWGFMQRVGHPQIILAQPPLKRPRQHYTFHDLAIIIMLYQWCSLTDHDNIRSLGKWVANTSWLTLLVVSSLSGTLMLNDMSSFLPWCFEPTRRKKVTHTHTHKFDYWPTDSVYVIMHALRLLWKWKINILNLHVCSEYMYVSCILLYRGEQL